MTFRPCAQVSPYCHFSDGLGLHFPEFSVNALASCNDTFTGKRGYMFVSPTNRVLFRMEKVGKHISAKLFENESTNYYST